MSADPLDKQLVEAVLLLQARSAEAALKRPASDHVAKRFSQKLQGILLSTMVSKL